MKCWLPMLLSCACALPLVAETPSTNAPVSKSSLSLDDSVDIALRHNTQVLKSKEEIHRNEGIVIETRGELVPQLTGSSTLLKREPQTAEFFQNTQLFESRLRLTQVLYAGGSIVSSVKAAYLSRQAAVLGFERIVADTILAVRLQFYEALFNEQLIQVREASVRLLEEQLETTKRRFEAGTVPKFDVLRADVELANARPPLIQARNNLRIAKIRLANLLALDVEKVGAGAFPYVLVGELKYEEIPDNLDEWLKIALQRRSELKELEKQVAVRKEGVHGSYAGYKPRLELYGQFEARNPTIGDAKTIVSGSVTNAITRNDRYGDLDPSIQGFSAGVQVTWDIFDGFATHGRVVQARALYEAARLDLEQKRREILLEVRASHSKLQEARETIESQKKVVEQGEESLRLAQARFNVGAGTQLDVLSAQTALTDARTTYAEALYNYNVAVANLERSTGVSTRIADLDDLRKR